MEYKIGITKTKDQTETTMICQFKDAAIAGLINLEQAGLKWDSWQRNYGYNALSITAKQDGKMFTFTAYQENAEQPLLDIATSLAVQESKYLPVMAYFNARVQALNENLHKWLDETEKEIKTLNAREMQSWKKSSENEDKIRAIDKEIQAIEETLNDFGDCLDADDERMSRIESALLKHSAMKFAHFPVIGKRINL